jgi:hypothetical protein
MLRDYFRHGGITALTPFVSGAGLKLLEEAVLE